MRKLGVLAAVAIFSLTSAFFAQGATKSITQTPMTLVTTISPSNQTTAMVVRGKTIYLIGTITGVVSTDGFIQAIDSTGTVQWSLPLDNGLNEIATTATSDSAGNIWAVGTAQTPRNSPSPSASPSPTDSATPTMTPTPTSTPTPTVLNPDGVSVDALIPMRPDLTSLTLWKVSPSGVLLATFTKEMGSVFFVRSATISNNSIAVVGNISTTFGVAGLLIQADLNGTFGKPLVVGKADTQLVALTKKSDGSLVLLGSSSETIAKQGRKGIKDGIVVVVSPAGKISSLVRSSNTASTRWWMSGTNSLFLGGMAIGKAKTEAVVTKFGSTLVPSWTSRFDSIGYALTADSPTSHFLVFPSIGAIAGVKGWKPTRASALTLSLDSKGVLNGAYGAPAIENPIAIGYSRDLGVVVLGQGPKGVSVFHALPR